MSKEWFYGRDQLQHSEAVASTAKFIRTQGYANVRRDEYLTRACVRTQISHLLLLACLWPGLVAGEESSKNSVDLGISVQDKAEAEQRLNAAGASLKTRKCVVVSSVDPHGPSSGVLRVDNAITTVAGVPTPDVASFNAAIASLKPGEAVEIKGLYLAPGPDKKPVWKGGTVKVTAAAGLVGGSTVAASDGTALPPPNTANRVPVTAPPVEDPVNASLLEAAVQCSKNGFEFTDEMKDALGFSSSSSDVREHGLQWTVDIPPGNTSRDQRIPFWSVHGSAGRYAYVSSRPASDKSADLWNLATGRRLKSEDKKVTELFAPLAFSPDGKYVASTDGTLTRVWEITGEDSLRLYCTGTYAADRFQTLHWWCKDYLEVCNVEDYRTPNVILKVGDRTLTAVPDPRMAVVEKHALLLTSSVGPTAVCVAAFDNRKGGRGLQSCDLTSTRIMATVPYEHDLAPLLPVPDASRPTSIYCTNDPTRVLVCLHDKDKNETYVVVTNPKTLTPIGRIPLQPRDSIGAISRGDTLLAVVRAEVTETQKTTETQWTINVYDLSRGAPLVSFSLGDEFASIGRRRDSAEPPQVAFSEDGRLLYVASVVSTRSISDGREVEKHQLSVGTWSLNDGARQRVLVRREDVKDKDDYSKMGLALCDDGLAVMRISDATHAASIDALMNTAAVIAEGHALVRKTDYKAAYAKYVEAMKANQEWFFRDQYAPMLNVGVDALAAAGEEQQARVVIKVLATARMRIAPQTDAGKTFVEKLVAEARERQEQKMAAGREQFARIRRENKARHIPCGQMMRREFVEQLDKCKDRGVMGPPATLLQFFNFAFQDAIGDPDQTAELTRGESEWGFRCKDGWVWLTVTGHGEEGVIVVTKLELR